jgi:hypothetical protein
MLAGCEAGPLPTLPRWEPGASCIGLGFDGELRGSRSDPRITWAVGSDGLRYELVWPRGYTARFVPGLEVLDEQGAVIARDGSSLVSGCPEESGGVEVLKVSAEDVEGE